MKVPVSWLNRYLDKKLTARAAAEAMELAGIEVEQIDGGVPIDPMIVVGQVLEVRKHPDADKLNLAKVDVKNTILSIVCGAPNLAEGQMVAVAQVGAKLPDGTEINKAKIRGQHSEGMICSEQELGLSNNHVGILVLPETAKLGQSVDEMYEPDEVIDVATAANRWDLTSIIGIAREVAAHSGIQVKASESELPSKSGGNLISATVENIEDVPRYMLARLSVDVGATTPEWMQQELQAAGLRPISIIVDITNYVMLEQGQPLHAFDAKTITSAISVRNAKNDELITTLDGKQHKLSNQDIVIADDKTILGVAGVMGGQSSEVTSATTEIILEAASFHPGRVRKTAVRYGLRTEASARFERAVPIQAAETGMSRAIALMVKHAGAEVTADVVDIASRPEVQTNITASKQRIESRLGIKLDQKKMISDLEKLKFEISVADVPDTFIVTVPWWRPDVLTEEDIAEEVIKLEGYESLPATLPAWKPHEINFDTAWSRLWQAKSVLRSLGLFEVVTYSFISQRQITDLGGRPEQYLQLQNPLSKEQEYLRAELLPSLLATAARNRRYAEGFGIFEFSKVFHKVKQGELPEEPLVLGVLNVVPDGGYVAAKQALDRLAREFNVEVTVRPKPFDPAISHPAQSAAIEIGGKHIGTIFLMHPDLAARNKIRGEIGYMELNWNNFLDGARPKSYQPISKYPSVKRDVSVLVDRKLPWADLEAAIGTGKSLEMVEYISDYYGRELPRDKKTITFRLTFVSAERTLTDEEADSGTAIVLERIKKAVHATPRD